MQTLLIYVMRSTVLFSLTYLRALPLAAPAAHFGMQQRRVNDMSTLLPVDLCNYTNYSTVFLQNQGILRIFYIFPYLNAIIISFVRLRSSASTGICSLSNHSAMASSSVSSVIPSSPSSSQKNPISSVSVKDHG